MSGSEKIEIFLKARRTVFENSKFRVFSDHIEDAQGNEIRDYLVVAPKVSAPRLVSGVAVVPVLNDCVVLVRMFRHAVDREVLEVPRGFVDPGESPEEAAIRELKEETGLVCRPERLIPLGTCMPEAGLIAAQVALFGALDCWEETRTERPEIGLGKCEKFTMHQTKELLREMTLGDTTTSLALHRLLLQPEIISRA
jgi:8-oxo-dGTP pyrophosphatase MutT (NUDIX family)